ncbi:hypothetical protein JCM5296_002741 [Sporobolomyces johnsonii]
MSAYTPLPTSSDPHSRHSNIPPLSSFAALRCRIASFLPSSLSSPPSPSFFDNLKPRTLRLIAWTGAASVILLLVVSLNSSSRAESLTASPRGGRLGQYTWLAGWSKGKGEKAEGASWRELPENEGLIEPEFTRDERTGYLMPPDVYPAALNPYKRANAAFVALVRNNEREAMRDSMRSVEMRFNRRAGYPWIFMNDEEFTTEFKEGVMSMTRSEVFFHVIPKEHWSYPEFINQTYAAEERQKMVHENVIYGGSESYRHMCRFNSMFFFQQKVLANFDWYWRVEPGIELFCDVDFDPFLFMEANEKVYGFTITLYEYRRTVESLWDTTREFARLHPEYIAEDNALGFLVDDKTKGLQDGEWNNCHFWSNFEIGDLRFWRSKAYMDYVEFLDKKGGFFYERWGDAPVHSLAVALFLPKDKVIHLDPIAYRHNPYTHCPQNNALYHANGKCECYAENDFNTHDSYSCQPRWWDLMGKWNY